MPTHFCGGFSRAQVLSTFSLRIGFLLLMAGPGSPADAQNLALHSIDPGAAMANVELGGGIACGDDELTQSANPNVILPPSVWCGSETTNSETSLARSFTVSASRLLRCIRFGVTNNTGGPWPVQVRLLSGPVAGPYAALTHISQTSVEIPAGASGAFFTADIPDALMSPGVAYVVELRTPSRLAVEGGDNALLSLGCNSLGETAPTYVRAPSCAIDDFVTLESVGFGTRHLVLVLETSDAAPRPDLFVSAGDQLLRFDGLTGSFRAVFAQDPVLSSQGMAFGPDGHLYVSNFARNSVHRFDGTYGAPLPCATCTGSEFVTSQSGGLVSPHGLIWRPSGELLVASIGSNNGVLRFDGSSGAAIGPFTFGPGQFPRGVTFGPSGEFFVTSNNNVLRYPATGGSSPSIFATHPAGGNTHYDLAFGPDGNLYLSSFATDKVLRFDGATGAFLNDFVTAGSGGLEGPTGIAFGPDGNLYVSSTITGQVLRYDGATGAFIGIFATTPGFQPPSYLVFSGPIDCNRNGVSDDVDIALGGIDSNGNGVPDECEPSAEKHGPVGVVITTPGGERIIPVPDLQVYSENVSTLAQSPTVISDLNGRFVIPPMLTGTYRVCWNSPEYVSDCLPRLIPLGSDTAFPGLLRVIPRPGVVFGRVLQRNGQPAIYHNEVFGVQLETYVEVLDSANQTVAVVRTNSAGEYVVPNLSNGTYTVIASADAANVSQAVALVGPQLELNLELPNAPPRIRSLFANVQAATPGATVTITAQASDPDDDPLSYSWSTTASGAPFVSTNSPSVSWTLPNANGRHAIYVLITDGRGGYTLQQLLLPTTGAGLPFGGRVLRDDGTPVAGADVTVNGQSALTDANGAFLFEAPGAGRFVLTVQAAGYQLISRVLTQLATSLELPLVSVAPVSINPTQPVTVFESPRYTAADVTRIAGCLEGPELAPAPPPPGTESACRLAFDYDDDGDVDMKDVAEFQRQFAPANPASVSFGANALRGPSGQLPSGPLSVSLSRIELGDSFGRLPGDLGAINDLGQDVMLRSFGAIEIEIRDGAGTLYNLAPGQTATVNIPIQSLDGAVAPPTIAIWFYDADAGVWLEDGSAIRAGDWYVAQVSHFSVINADVEFSNASCLEIAFSPLQNVPFVLKVSVPDPSPTHVFTSLIQDPTLKSVLHHLPINTNIKVEILDINGNPAAGAVTQFFNTGAAVPGNGLNPVYPYTGCHPITVNLPFVLPTPGTFLDFVGLDNSAAAAAYYNTIDPTSAKTTLAAWKTANGFGTDDAEAYYFNALDLGFGRAMHMKKSGGNRAYYVTNFTNADEAILGALPIATVAMEYSQVGGSGPLFTKFYVYNSAGARVSSADLDGAGPKFIPRLCIVCHGNNPGTVTGLTYSNTGDVDAEFIPFPLDSFTYAHSLPGSAQEADFKELNREVLATGPSPAVTQMVNGWYGGVGLPNPLQNPGFVPSGWTPNPAMYNSVVKQSCRICHSTRAYPVDWSAWSDPTNLAFKERGGTHSVYVRTIKKMPNAKATWQQFHGTGQCELLRTGGLDGWPLSATCP